eukprot:GHVR01119095.1.p1 GENE.GHVR01119095.1~~GHVR01119095.1.p1  ORF type:complete len:532 (+),score=106.65 GHVR01119095.1:236-1597(+)
MTLEEIQIFFIISTAKMYAPFISPEWSRVVSEAHNATPPSRERFCRGHMEWVVSAEYMNGVSKEDKAELLSLGKKFSSLPTITSYFADYYESTVDLDITDFSLTLSTHDKEKEHISLDGMCKFSDVYGTADDAWRTADGFMEWRKIIYYRFLYGRLKSGNCAMFVPPLAPTELNKIISIGGNTKYKNINIPFAQVYPCLLKFHSDPTELNYFKNYNNINDISNKEYNNKYNYKTSITQTIGCLTSIISPQILKLFITSARSRHDFVPYLMSRQVKRVSNCVLWHRYDAPIAPHLQDRETRRNMIERHVGSMSTSVCGGDSGGGGGGIFNSNGIGVVDGKVEHIKFELNDIIDTLSISYGWHIYILYMFDKFVQKGMVDDDEGFIATDRELKRYYPLYGSGVVAGSICNAIQAYTSPVKLRVNAAFYNDSLFRFTFQCDDFSTDTDVCHPSIVR